MPCVGAHLCVRPFTGDSPGGAPARRAHRIWCQKRWENHQGLRALDPGVYGGGKLYQKGRNRACIHARFLFGFVTGAAAPWVARIGIAPQSQRAAALYRPGPPGRRRCHASEMPWRFWWLANGASGMPRPT